MVQMLKCFGSDPEALSELCGQQASGGGRQGVGVSVKALQPVGSGLPTSPRQVST